MEAGVGAVSETGDTAPANPGDGAAAVTFTADSTVRKFEILSLTTDIAQDGTASYTLGDPLYTVSELPQGMDIVPTTEEVTMELTNGLSPIVLTPVDDKNDFAYMILPVRIKN